MSPKSWAQFIMQQGPNSQESRKAVDEKLNQQTLNYRF